MTNNKVSEDVFDAVLKNAFADAFKLELKEYEAEAEKYKTVLPTAKQKKAARRAYNAQSRGAGWGIVITRRVAAAVLIAFSLGSGMMLSAPAVRAAVVDTVIEFFDKYMSFDFSEKAGGVVIGDYTLGYLPDGYTLSDSFKSDAKSAYVFSNGILNIRISIMPGDISKRNIDNENYEMKVLNITDYTAYSFAPNDPEMDNIVIMGNADISITFKSNNSIDELIKIAKNFR